MLFELIRGYICRCPLTFLHQLCLSNVSSMLRSCYRESPTTYSEFSTQCYGVKSAFLFRKEKGNYQNTLFREKSAALQLFSSRKGPVRFKSICLSEPVQFQRERNACSTCVGGRKIFSGACCQPFEEGMDSINNYPPPLHHLRRYVAVPINVCYTTTFNTGRTQRSESRYGGGRSRN